MDEGPDGTPVPAEMARAEELVDQMTRSVGDFVSKIGLQVLKGAARAREEVEDIWAEAQSMRGGE